MCLACVITVPILCCWICGCDFGTLCPSKALVLEVWSPVWQCWEFVAFKKWSLEGYNQDAEAIIWQEINVVLTGPHFVHREMSYCSIEPCLISCSVILSFLHGSHYDSKHHAIIQTFSKGRKDEVTLSWISKVWVTQISYLIVYLAWDIVIAARNRLA